MSLCERDASRPPSRGEVEVKEEDEERRTEEDFPLLALAPDASLPEEQPPAASTDASACPVFQCLDEMLLLGEIDLTKAARLKANYNLLHDRLKRSQDSELQCLGEAKRRRAELERLHTELERTEEQSASDEPESEVTELRQRLLQAYNELKAAENTAYETQRRLKCLREEKQYLEKENEIQPRPAELESRTKALQDKCENLRTEVAQRHLEVRSLTEDVEAHESQILKEQKELEEQKGIIELKEAEKAQLIDVPGQILQKIERKHSKKEAAAKTTEALSAEIAEMEQHLKKVELCNRSLGLQKEEATLKLQALRARVEASQVVSRQLLKEQEVNREERTEIVGTRGILEMKLQNIMCDRKHLYERQSVQLGERNRQMQALKRMEHALTIATEQQERTQAIYNELQAQLLAVPRRDASIQQRMELQREVDALKAGFEKQLSVAEEESQKKQQYGVIQELLRESNDLREELHNLRSLAKIKAEERGQKHRDLLRAEQLHQRAQHELLEKDLVVMDQNKLNTMLQHRILRYSKLCDMMAEEKIKYAKLRQIASERISEMKEQLRVLENEMDIQRAIVVNKDRLLTKARRKLSSSSKARDKLRSDISKVAWKHRQIAQQTEDNKLDLAKLAKMINLQEQALLEMNKSHETAVERRNFLGIQLLEHEEVLFGYQEKVNVQEAAITRGNVELESMEKEMKDLQSAMSEERRRIDVKRKEVPVSRELEEGLTMLQIELSEARDKTIECLNRTMDYKEIKGNDPSAGELVKKIEQLELMLAERERQLLEKQLLVDQVTRLSKPLSEQAENCQEDRLSVRKKLNDLRTHIIEANRRLMAVSAELSVKQAVALSQQQGIKERELQMDRCQRRLEQGLPPCPEMEEEWRRMLRDKKRRQRDKAERDRLAEEDEWNQLPNGEYTTAELRPGAYIPRADALPLPKPYGAQTPFKPPQPGANMRHFRKPTLKPLETQQTM